MKQIKRMVSLLLVIVLLLSSIPAAAATTETEENTVRSTSLEILPYDPYDIYLAVGESMKLQVENLPAGTTKEDIEWRYDETCVRLEGDTLTAIAPGVSRIFADVVVDGVVIEGVYDYVVTYTLSGFCGAEGDGSNLTWEIDPDSKTLTISGKGPMADYISFWSEWGVEYKQRSLVSLVQRKIPS